MLARGTVSCSPHPGPGPSSGSFGGCPNCPHCRASGSRLRATQGRGCVSHILSPPASAPGPSSPQGGPLGLCWLRAHRNEADTQPLGPPDWRERAQALVLGGSALTSRRMLLVQTREWLGLLRSVRWPQGLGLRLCRENVQCSWNEERPERQGWADALITAALLGFVGI